MPETVGRLPSKYVASEHEPRILERWLSSGAFHANPARAQGGGGDKPPYCIVIPPPNVTDRLHLGHALNNTLQDVLARAHRLQGFETLWLPGTDHAGIATQTKVDRILKERGEPAIAEYKKMELAGEGGREKFIEKVQAWKDEFETTILGQLRLIGCSCDWERTRFTMDDICARAVREAFFRLFRDGLIYRGKRLVNWDPATQTALADDEVENQEIDGAFYYMRYPLLHAEGAASGRPVTWSELFASGYPKHLLPKGDGLGDEDAAFVTVATTRPETYLGDTAVAVHPKDPRRGALHGLVAELPLVGRKIPIIEDDYVVIPDWVTGEESGDAKAAMATGFLKVTPAHDPNDWAIGLRHDLPVINVMGPDAGISDQHGWEDIGDAHVFVGKSREEARKLVTREFEARGLLEDRKPHRHSVGHSYRSHVPIEPYLSDQWYVKVTDERLVGFAQRALAPDQRSGPDHKPTKGVAGDGELQFFPERYAKTYETWHDNLRDWCISRQLWWGHRIPVWWSFEDPEGSIGDSDSVRLAIQTDTEHVFRQRFGDRTCMCIREPNPEYERQLEEAGWTQDEDVLDTWFSSALWPLNTMGWPDPDQSPETAGLLDVFNPTNVLSTAREIITLWVSRMVMFNRYFTSPDGGKTPGRLPFKDVFIHAMIQDGEGRKMSKSLGNGVDPLDITASYGTDALRFTLCKMTTQTQDVRMPVEPDPTTGRNTSPKFDEGRNFATKLWNAARFTMMNLEPPPQGPAGSVELSELDLADRWILSRLARVLGEVNGAITQYQFNAYAQSLYDLLWRDFCDWYLEAIKPTVKASPAQQTVVHRVLDAFLRMLHPICPFITEAIAEPLVAIPHGRVHGLDLPDLDGLLCLAAWPTADPALIDPGAEEAFGRVQGLVDAIRQVRTQRQIPPRERLTLHAGAEELAIASGAGGIVEALAGLDALSTDPAPDGSLEVRFEGRALGLSGFEATVDEGAVRASLTEQLAKIEKDVVALEKRLGNPGYVDKAPAKLVEETRGQLSAKQAEATEIRARLEAM